jgi:hypothetical protein
MATVYEQNLANLSKDLGIQSTLAPQLSSNPFSNIFGGQDPSSLLSSSMGIPQGVGMSGESSTPIGNGSAQNSAQSAMKEQSNLQKAFDGVQSLYSPMGGRPIAGSEDVKVKVDAYGRPYTVVSMTPTDSQGRSQKAETLSFGISPEQKASSSPQMSAPQGQIAAGTTPKFGDKEVFNPFARQNEAQMQEYNRRKQNSMS